MAQQVTSTKSALHGASGVLAGQVAVAAIQYKVDLPSSCCSGLCRRSVAFQWLLLNAVSAVAKTDVSEAKASCAGAGNDSAAADVWCGLIQKVMTCSIAHSTAQTL